MTLEGTSSLPSTSGGRRSASRRGGSRSLRRRLARRPPPSRSGWGARRPDVHAPWLSPGPGGDRARVGRMEFFAEPPGSQILAVGAIIVGALILAWLARIFVHGIVKALLDREATEGTAQELSAVELRKRMDTLHSLGAHVLQAFIAVIATLMVLGQLGLDIGPAVAGLGVVGIAVGFGAQAFVRDYLNGALILIENQFAKGDVVQVAGVTGTVEDFSLRRTTLRDL